MTVYREAGCSRGWMQQLETNVGRRQLDDMPEPAASAMRMSADDDDQAEQQRELADPGMTETETTNRETNRVLPDLPDAVPGLMVGL